MLKKNRVQQILKNMAFSFYNLAWKAAIPFLRHNHRLADGFLERTLSVKLTKADIWIQAASAGESHIALTLLKTFRLVSGGSANVLITTNTRQGLDILNKGAPDIVNGCNMNISTAFFPFDKPVLMEAAVKQVSPGIMILMETEMWPGHLAALKKHQSKILIINGRITEKSLNQYLLWPSLWRSLMPDKICAVTPMEAKRFACLFDSASVDLMPNIKFDTVAEKTDYSALEKQIKQFFNPETSFLVLGSVRGEEEADINNIILEVFSRFPGVVIGFFPRHLHRIFEIQEELNRVSIKFILRSEIKEPVSPGTVILWDAFGELGAAYNIAHAAFVGGSLAPLGGQNFLEPLVSGIIPVTGPYWDNFKWIGKEIFRQGLVQKASGWKETALILVENLKNPAPRKTVEKKARVYIKDRQGGALFASRVINSFYS